MTLNDYQRDLIRQLLPAALSGLITWLIILTIGETPLSRSIGLALVIVGVTLALRRFGALLSVIGGLALAFSPAFWSQTSGGTSTPATIVIALVVATGAGALVVMLSKRPYIALMFALIAFGLIFFSQIGQARSLRLNLLTNAWLIYLLINAVLLTNPRPDEPPPARLNAQYRAGILLLLAIGVINDPVAVFFVPAVALGLAFSKTRLRWWYWGLFWGIAVLGIYGIATEYFRADLWGVSAIQAEAQMLPYLVADGWNDPYRWLGLFNLIVTQFTVFGLILGIIGMARLYRWYPILGSVMLTAYASFFVFGLLYFGRDRAILALPLLIIQVIWMTYAVYVFGQWLEKTLAAHATPIGRVWIKRAVSVLYLLLPLFLLLQHLN